MSGQRLCAHRCQAINHQDGLQCKRLARLEDGEHHLIWFKDRWANLCRPHFEAVFDDLFGRGPVQTRTGICTHEAGRPPTPGENDSQRTTPTG